MNPPQEYLDQLKVGGRLVMPLGPQGDQYIYSIDKLPNGKFKSMKGLSVRYVALTDEKNQAKFSAGKSWVQGRDNYLGYVIYTEDDLLDGNRYSTELSKEKLLSKLKFDLNLTQI
jgi:hypothetical protein